MSISEREEMFGKTESGYLWCLKCERTYKESEYRTVVNGDGDLMEMCHYEDCRGDAFADAWDWDKLKELHGYPEKPEKGKVYPQFG